MNIVEQKLSQFIDSPITRKTFDLLTVGVIAAVAFSAFWWF